MSESLNKMSTRLCYYLRHDPDAIGLSLDSEGWADISEIVRLTALKGVPITREQIIEIVENDEKSRYGTRDFTTKIRCVQGHSTPMVAIKFKKAIPPPELYHGTAKKNVPGIVKEGLHAGKRHYVHLSTDIETATNVGKRHGEVIVLTIDTRKLVASGHQFFISENGVWLTESIPVKHIKF